jgi:signal transduction histidine kinase
MVLGAALCVAAVAGGAIAASAGEPLRTSLAAAALGGLLACTLAPLMLSRFERHEPRSTAAAPVALLRSLCRAGTRDELIRVIECQLPQVMGAAGAQLLADGELRPSHGARELRAPVRCDELGQGVLRVWRAPQATPFHRHELELLQAAASVVVASLSLVRRSEELGRESQRHAEAWRAERSALVETVAAEILHEIRYPINFFRSVFQRGCAGGVLDAEEVEIGCEEVERLERLVSGLRRLPRARLERHPVRIAELAARAEMLLRDRLPDGRLHFSGAGNDAVLCDPDQVTQVVVNLLSNALDACGSAGEAGLRWHREKAAGRIVVWDTGPGFSAPLSRLFVPWCTSKPHGTGLGLTISHRIVKAHGWAIDALRQETVTVFEVAIPARDVIGCGADVERVGLL